MIGLDMHRFTNDWLAEGEDSDTLYLPKEGS